MNRNPQAKRSAGAKLLPPLIYRSALNPIEQVFAKLKHRMRRPAEGSREATWQRSGSLLDTFYPSFWRFYLLNAGYGPD